MFAEPSAQLRLTWPDLVRLVDRHPRLAASPFERAAAQAGVELAGAVPNPTLEASVGRANPGDSDAQGAQGLEWQLALNVPLGWIVSRSARVEQAEAEREVALQQTQGLRREVLLELGSLFWGLAYSQAQAEELERLFGQMTVLKEGVASRVRHGEARPVEFTRVAVETERVTGELESARALLRARRAELGLWILPITDGRTTPPEIIAQVDTQLLPSRPTGADNPRSQAEQHPEVRVGEARVRSLVAQSTLEHRARIPGIELKLLASSEIDKRALGVGLVFELPVWNWNSPRIAQSEALLAASRQQAVAKRLTLEARIQADRAACESSLASARHFTERLLPLAQTAADTIERSYQLGESNLLELIDARRTLLEACRQSLAAWHQAQLDCFRYRILTGEELP